MARGRMLNQTVSASLKFQQLPNDTCRLLATWIIPYLDLNGVYYADPTMVKSAVFPRRADITPEMVAGYLDAIEGIGLIVRFEAKGDLWQWWPGFAGNQVGLRRDRESTNYPLPPRQNGGEPTAPIPPVDGPKPAEGKGTEVNGTELPTGADAPPPIPNTFQEWEEALNTYSNHPALLKRMIDIYYPGLDPPPTYGEIGAIAKKMGRGRNGYHRLMDLAWKQSASPPKGDLLPYLLRVHQGKEKNNGRPNAHQNPHGTTEPVELATGFVEDAELPSGPDPPGVG